MYSHYLKSFFLNPFALSLSLLSPAVYYQWSCITALVMASHSVQELYQWRGVTWYTKVRPRGVMILLHITNRLLVRLYEYNKQVWRDVHCIYIVILCMQGVRTYSLYFKVPNTVVSMWSRLYKRHCNITKMFSLSNHIRPILSTLNLYKKRTVNHVTGHVTTCLLSSSLEGWLTWRWSVPHSPRPYARSHR